ncbi:hypothetical protein CEK25_012374 [Fusarium fujikuroi]|nr:hypothetical protein CEK25_012374 [Fusarium fujikuroi]
MVVLSDLPDETLDRVFDFVTSDRVSLENVSLVNRRFNKIVFPLLVRQWNNSQECVEPSIERLALHLLRSPHLRRHVERLDFGYLRPLHDHDPDSVDLSPESLIALANAAEKDLQVSEFLSTHVCHRIRLGCEDAIAVLILAWCTRLTHLNITIPSFYPESRQHFMPLLYMREAVSRLLDEPAEMASQLPLGRIRHVTLQPWNRETTFDMAYAISFLHLPGIQTLCAHGLFDDPDDGLGSEENELPLTHLDDYVSHPGSVFEADYGQIYGGRTRKSHSKGLLKHKCSLEDLDLDISILDRFPNPDPVLEPYSQMFIDSWVCSITDLFEEPFLERTIELLYQDRPRSKYLKLRVLKLPFPHVHDPIKLGLKSSNDVASSRGAIPGGHYRITRERWTTREVQRVNPDLSEAFVDDPLCLILKRIKLGYISG